MTGMFEDFLGLKFSILGFFLGGNIWQVFWLGYLAWDFGGVNLWSRDLFGFRFLPPFNQYSPPPPPPSGMK